MEKLVFYSMAGVLFVEFIVTVFGVSQERMTSSGQVGSDLMCSACDQFYFQECHFSITVNRAVCGFDWQGIREILFAYGYFVGFFVFVQVAFDMGRFVQFAFYQTEIVFMERSVMEDSG